MDPVIENYENQLEYINSRLTMATLNYCRPLVDEFHPQFNPVHLFFKHFFPVVNGFEW